MADSSNNIPSFGYIATPEALFNLISNEAMPNGNLSVRGVTRMADVSCTAIFQGANFNSRKMARKLAAHGFEAANLIENGFPPVAVILALEYFAYESHAKAPGAKSLMQLFGAVGLRTVLSKLAEKSSQAVEVKSLPQRDTIDYINAASLLPTLKVNHLLKQLLEDSLTDDLELMRNQKLLSPGIDKRQYTIVKVRAKELGYAVDKIGGGSSLGRFVAQRIQPAMEERVGKYMVKHYEVNPQLDETIHAYFR